MRRDRGLTCDLLHGGALHVAQGSNGPVHLFGDQQLVGYRIVGHGRWNAFVFRTDAERGRQKLPGVHPAVRLLVHARTRGTVTRLAETLRYLRKHTDDLDALPEAFFVRLHGLLPGRRWQMDHVRTLLSHAKL